MRGFAMKISETVGYAVAFVLGASCLASLLESAKCSSIAPSVIGILTGLTVLCLVIVSYVFSGEISAKYFLAQAGRAKTTLVALLSVNVTVKGISMYSCGHDITYIPYVIGLVIVVFSFLLRAK